MTRVGGIWAAALLVAACGRGAEQEGGPRGPFRTEVPAHALNIILGRVSDTGVTARIVTQADAEGFVLFGRQGDPCTNATARMPFRAGEPADVAIGPLAGNAAYWYRFCHGVTPGGAMSSTPDYRFHTQRAPGKPFTFTVTADSHLDVNTDVAVYEATLRQALAVSPDFHIDLGDTFMTGKRGDRPGDALPQYLAQRYYFGLLCHSTPLFLVLGNHDGETGRTLDPATSLRTRYFPNPQGNGFHGGNPEGSYYAWTWGDALFVALDPYRYSPRPRHGGQEDRWAFTLGRAQYDWLVRTLQASRARFKFVFTHHLVGGLDRQGRGGAEAVRFGEWGGCDADGRQAFAERRLGWEAPIHALLARNGVSAVFHGHDHFYARQEVDGIVYQLVPQPGHPGEGSIREAPGYGYKGGEFQPGAGFLRVSVSSQRVAVAYVRTVPMAEGGVGPGGRAVCEYVIPRPQEGSVP